MDIALILEQLSDAKELVQSAMEEIRKSTKPKEVHGADITPDGGHGSR